MGRVKGRNIKVIAKQLVDKFPASFTKEYKNNLAKVREMGLMTHSKLEAHKLGGELTNEVSKRLQEPKKRKAPMERRPRGERRDFRDRGDRDRR